MSKHLKHSHVNFFCLYIFVKSFLWGLFIPLFWAFGDVSSGIQRQSGLPYSHLAEAYMSWFVGAHCFPHLSCLAMVVKPGQGLVTGITLLHLSVKRIANGCPQGGHLDST